MRIYFVGQKGIPTLNGGVERHVEELATRLADKGHEVFVYTRPHYTPADLTKCKGVNLISLPTIKTKHLDAIVHTFMATIDAMRRDADIIHYHAIGPAALSWLPRLLKPGIKVFFTFHCQDYKHQKWGALARAFLRIGERMGVCSAHQAIAVSQTLKKYVKARYGRSVIYLPNGCPEVKVRKANGSLAQFGLKRGEYYLSVSRLIRHKGIHTLIKAYAKLKTSRKLVIVGDGAFTDSYVKELHKLANGNPNIVFAGNQTGRPLAELYSNAYAFVQPSEAEGMSISLLEALAYGRPVIISDIDENKEVVGDQMLSFKNKQVRDLLGKLKFLDAKSERAAQLSRVAHKIIARYQWKDIVKGTEALYRVEANGTQTLPVVPNRKMLGARVK